MAVRKKQPPSLRKILVEALRAASLSGANFESTSEDAWLPTSEQQVNKFIFQRTLVWRESKLRRPLQLALSLIDQNKIS